MRHGVRVCIGLLILCHLIGCAGFLNPIAGAGADQTAQNFFDDLRRSHRESAYGFFAKGLSQVLAFEQFDGLLEAVQRQWGQIQYAETVEMPFHQRIGEDRFIPIGVKSSEIKRYVFEVQFDRAMVNWDLSLAKQDGMYKIIWLSLWGSSNDFTPAIREKIEGLFEQGQ